MWKDTDTRSLPSRERGLKSVVGHDGAVRRESLPSRERGLKFQILIAVLSLHLVAPFTGAWIEMLKYLNTAKSHWSLPSRERGLKSPPRWASSGMRPWLPSRERGLKFESLNNLALGVNVAPFTGAWIEIVTVPKGTFYITSLPSRERGLKCQEGCRPSSLVPSLPSRERGLKS